MNEKILLGSIMAVAIIVLSSFSSVAGKVSSDNELVEFDVEFCGLGKKYTVKLTQQEADEVELLFNDIHEQLNEVETRDEAEEMFKEVVVELDKYGLLGGLSVRQAQQLIVGNNVRQSLLKRIDGVDTENIPDFINANYFCLIGGHLDFMGSQNPLVRRFSIFMDRLLVFALEIDNWDLVDLCGIISPLFMMFGIISDFTSGFIPFSIFRTLGAGRHVMSPVTPEHWFYPSQGQISSYGLFGSKQWEGGLWGVASRHLIIGSFIEYYPAILGFTGIKLTNDNYETYFFGFALKASMSNEQPDH